MEIFQSWFGDEFKVNHIWALTSLSRAKTPCKNKQNNGGSQCSLTLSQFLYAESSAETHKSQQMGRGGNWELIHKNYSLYDPGTKQNFLLTTHGGMQDISIQLTFSTLDVLQLIKGRSGR
ncbi:hypothetical protein DAPPUDRAFT_109204 [Daphnia pulex]|uniref:Uncharacterized protein n=1 Tax=Daphnia pulex TaxID=6669 RepID=E9H298_DAPPU|nr:hypothetical protein DAPPUDRAFT_109204 [Daphnia pulex]|eukprot:EFX74133.1 hypothetical protein DAPPUDRAFT_109204 [Daphnia pulex]